MTSIRAMITAAIGAAAVAGTAIAVATAGDASAGTPSTGTFTVRAHEGGHTNIDLGKKGFSAGDEDLSAAPLTYQGKTVGRLVANCTVARVGRSSADQLCEFVLHLGSSQLTADGTVRAGHNGPGTFTLPILGGTGRYRSAGGVLAVTATNSGTVPISVSLDR
jgi:hypothetical protein